MVNWEAFVDGIFLLLSWKTPLLIFAGMLTGLILGIIPGLTGSIGIAILLPVTFLMSPLDALVMLTSVYTGGLTGGGITAILINTPGSPGAIATTFDGYPMTRKGLQNEALGLQITSSVIGGISGYVFLFFFINSIVKFALQFGPSEMIFLTILVLVIIGSLRGKSMARTFYIGIFGLMVGTIGSSEATGVVRGTMGFDGLEDGIPRVICIVGLFAVPEMLNLITKKYILDVKVLKSKNITILFKGVKETFRYLKSLIRGILIGISIGTLPAAGSTVSALLSYSQAKASAKKHQHYGEGEPEGIVAAETANNASEGGAMAILLALGIPGSGATAILLAGFALHGLVPGPRLFHDNAAFVYGLISANIIQMFFLGFIALFVSFYFSRLIFIPTRILAPALMAVMAMGAYSVRNLFFDIYLLFIIGILGWFFRRYDFPTTSFVIGYILGENLDMEVYRYMSLFGFDSLVFLERPITGLLIIATFIVIGLQINRYRKSKQ